MPPLSIIFISHRASYYFNRLYPSISQFFSPKTQYSVSLMQSLFQVIVFSTLVSHSAVGSLISTLRVFPRNHFSHSKFLSFYPQQLFIFSSATILYSRLLTQSRQSLYLSWLFTLSTIQFYQQNAVFLLKKHYFVAPLLHYFDSTNLRDFPYFEINALEAVQFSIEARKFNAQID